MDEPTTFLDWPAKRDAIRATLATREPRLRHTGPLRLSDGAVDEPGGIMTALVARAAFLEIAAAVAPQMLAELAGEPLDQYEAAWHAAGGPACADPCRPEVGVGNDVLLPAQSAMFNPRGALWRWCERWGLPVWDDMTAEALGPDDRSLMRFAATRGWGLVEGAYAVYTWRVSVFQPESPHALGRVLLTTILVDDRDLELEAPLCLPPQRWDPQREDRAGATKRITAELGRAVRAELGRIEAEALQRAVPPPAKRTGVDHLAWLARYQFRHESFPTIARDAHVGRQAVAAGVKDAAALIGLPLREPNPPGRPRKAR